MAIKSTTLDNAVFTRAARRPDALALTGVEGDLTYAELARRSGRWAADLADHGVGPGTIVPLALPRGHDLVVAILAVLRAGAATTILDPAWPRARREHVVRVVDAPLVVGAQLADRPSWRPPPPRLGSVDGPQLVRPDEASRPAAVFFTSGTTGEPKGVVVSHAAIGRLFTSRTFARFGTGEAVPLAAALPWDAFAFELWAALATGGTSIVMTQPYMGPEELRQCVAKYGATTAWLTSSLLNMIVEEDVGALAGLRQLLTGGEQLSPEHVRRVLTRHPGIALTNGYGPVEGTVFTTTHRIALSDCDRPDGIPVGRPVPGTRVMLLDGERLCRPGEQGEICIAGTGLAGRDIGDAAASAVRFPTLRVDGRLVRVHRSGDLGVVDGDGVLHFRGRIDDQIKIRGHRVEPRAVEAVLMRRFPEITACRVLPRRDGRGLVTALVAYCSPAAPPDAASKLATTLAEPERPASFRSVAVFPLTATGKLDIAALAAIDAHEFVAGAAFDVRNRDPLVALIAEVFAAVLEVEAVATDVGFVDIGGNSLAASRVCVRLGDALQRPVPASAMSSNVSAESLAGWLSSTADPEAGERPDPSPLAPLSDLQRGFLLRALVEPRDPTGPCRLLWRVDGQLDTDAFDYAVTYVHHRHEALRATYVTDPALGALVSSGPPPAVAVLEAFPDFDAALEAIAAYLSAPLAPHAGEVWRVARAPVLDRGYALGCAVHHIAFDGASESLLARDLAVGYRVAIGAQVGTVDPPTPMTQAARAYAKVRSRGRRPGDGLRLRNELADAAPIRWYGPREGQAEVLTSRTGIEPDLVAAIDHDATTHHLTRFVVLLDAWARALAGLTGVDDFVVGIPVSQRDDARLSDVVGCYLAMVAVRLIVDERQGREGRAEAIRRAMAGQDIPLSKIFGPADVNGNRLPMYQVLFALQDNPPPTLDLPGVVTRFGRPPYLAVPLELHTEVWTRTDGGLEVVVSWQADVVPAEVGRALGPALVEVLATSARTAMAR